MLSVDAGEVHVREDGPSDGPAIMLIHGFASSMHTFDRLAPLLAETCRVVRVDLLGHGCTGGDTGLAPHDQGAMAASVAAALELKEVTAVGHSFGADVALAFAEQSERVARLVLVGQAPDYSYAKLPRLAPVMALPMVGPMLHRLTAPPVVRFAGRFAFAPGFSLANFSDHPHRMFLDHSAMSPGMYRTVLVERAKAMRKRPLDVWAGELGLPTLAIVGRLDQLYDCAQTVARYRRAGARVAVVEGAGHSPIIERPVTTARLIRRFLAPE